MGKYRRKPVAVQAYKFTKDQPPWPDGVMHRVACAGCGDPCTEDDAGVPCDRCGSGVVNLGAFVILTEDGWCRISDGDWVVSGPNGERQVYQSDVFEQTYEPIECLKCYGKGWYPEKTGPEEFDDYREAYCDCGFGNDLREKDEPAK